MSRETERRADLVQSLRDLADAIESAELPVDVHEEVVVRHCVHARPARGVAEIDRIASLLETRGELTITASGHVRHTTRRRFGESLVYEASYERRRRHRIPEAADGPWFIRYRPSAEQIVALEASTRDEALAEAREMRQAGVDPTRIDGPDGTIGYSGQRLEEALRGEDR